ncbi:MAG: hypothetical protein KDA53_01005 [Hyphomonas sp.]|nr:hypothetical protein [Hyphomonas sp.]
MRCAMLIAPIAALALPLAACAAAPIAEEAAPAVVAEAAPAMAPPRCDPGTLHPDAPPEMQQYAFLVGDFEVSSHIWLGEDWSPPKPGPSARWNGWWGLGGTVLYDEWFTEDPGLVPDTLRGVNVRYYDDAEGVWKMMWISTAGRQVQDLRAEMRDGKLTMWQVYPDRPGFLADFTVEDEDHWYRTQYNVEEDGSLTPAYLLKASRIPCA